MSLLVVAPGTSTTVQDLGRPGYRAWGVPLGGVFDRFSAAQANALLGNDPSCSVLEFTLVGGTYEALGPMALALAGASLETRRRKANGQLLPIRIPSAFSLETGDRLIVGGSSRGARAYLGVLEGWQTPLVLGSRSSEVRLRAGDSLDCVSGTTPNRHVELASIGTLGDAVRIIPGPEAHLLDAFGLDIGATFRVSPQSNRMGLRLEGASWPIPSDSIRESAPVAPGAIQAPGDMPVLLGVACGTMGGYPHVAHVISTDLDRVAQLKAGDSLRFSMIRVEEARHLDHLSRLEQARSLSRMTTAARDGLARRTPVGK